MIRRLIGTVLAAVVLSAPAAAADQLVIADGHIDMGPRFVNGTWTVQIRDDTTSPPSWRDLSEVVLRVVDAAKTQVPPDPAYSFLGAAGSSVWLLPQVQRPGVLWPGWNTQDPHVAATVNREVTWKLRGVRGPGKFVLFLSGNFGTPQVIFDSGKPFPQETGVEVNSHVHGNWTFSAAGTYQLEVEMSGSTTDGKALTDVRTLRIHVGDGQPEAPEPITPAAPAVVAAQEPSNTSMWWWGGGVIVIVLAGIALLRRGRTRG